MEKEFLRLIWKTGNSLVITIPKEIQEKDSIQEGDYIVVVLKKKLSLKK